MKHDLISAITAMWLIALAVAVVYGIYFSP